MLYGKQPTKEFLEGLQQEEREEVTLKVEEEKTDAKGPTFNEKLRNFFKELIGIYGPSSLRNKALICHFCW
jgi:hypothetical protein